jgi:thiosulfate/3-mercaptopyruvate sulfurtransferase
MISTFYGLDQLVTAPSAMTFLAALVIGLLFGFALERAGFGSSRKLAGIFYLRDMTVLRVMFTALITAMLGLWLVVALGWVDLESQVYLLPTVYGAQVVGGLIFGVGFVLSGWCPGTGAVGVASGKLDALVFFVGVVIGAILYNETYGLTSGLRGEGTVLLAFGLSRGLFALLFTLVAVGSFYFAEWVERQVGGGGKYLNSTFLRTMSVVLVIAAVAVFILPSEPGAERMALAGSPSDQALLEAIEAAEDHIEPEELADAMLQGDGNLVVVDVRSADEYNAFHIRGAVNVPLPELIEYLAPYKNHGRIVLYSNGMTHPAQARDTLARLGYQNVFMLTDGLQGFLDRCLKPVSLRREPLAEPYAERVRAWRAFFLPAEAPPVAAESPKQLRGPAVSRADGLPGLVETAWLAESLGDPDLKIIDVRGQPLYNTSHISGSVALNPESLRGVVGGVSSMLLPASLLAEEFGLMGVRPTDTVIVIPGDKFRDATLVGMALDRVGHSRWGVLNGGFDKWLSEKRPVDNSLPEAGISTYNPAGSGDAFTVQRQTVLSAVGDSGTVIIDTRPGDYFTGKKSDEARAGHIPGALNRPYSEDLGEDGRLKPVDELAAAYRRLLPSSDTPVMVHCRTGHQASQTYFVLRHLLGYRNVRWYDGSWTDWAPRPELPVTQ